MNSGIDLDKPILGILIYGKDDFSNKIRDYFKSKGYQIVALSMYNPYADLNLGHILDPFEWAEVFKYLTFCISDRFHGTIFCLKNKTPFVSIEPIATLQKESKLYSLLNDFDMLQCYENIDEGTFDMDLFLDKCVELENSWNGYANKINSKLEDMKNRNDDYIKKIKEVLEDD